MKIKIINTNLESRNDVLEKITQVAKEENFISDSQKVFDALIERENQGTTGFADGIAIPHARINEIKESIILIARNDVGVNWSSLDGKPTTTAIALLVEGGNEANDLHLRLLAKIAKNLVHNEAKEIFKNGSIDQIQELIK